MKTIELMINGQKAQFTTKSVTVDGKEYFYSNMTQLDHSPVVHTYRFEYEDGDVKLLTYEKKDAKIMAAIFSQVNKMLALKKAKAAQNAAEPAKPAESVKKHAAEAHEDEKVEKAEKPAEVSDDMDEMIKATIAINKERERKEAEKASKKARKKAIKEAKKNGTPLPKEEKKEDGNEGISEKGQPIDPEKQTRIKKSLKVFSIVLIVIIAVSIAYYFVFGTSNIPSDSNPNVTESQQYEDVDQLIEELQ